MRDLSAFVSCGLNLSRAGIFPLAALCFLGSTACLSAAPVRVTIPWEQGWPVVTPATAADFGISLKNEAAEPARLVFFTRLFSPSGVEEKASQEVSLAAGEEKKIPLPMTGKEMGCWTLQYQLIQESEQNQEGKTVFL